MSDLSVNLGTNIEGNIVTVDLEACMLITGSSGRGKTNTIYNIIDTLLEDNSTCIDIWDLKGLEYNHYISDRVQVFENFGGLDELLDGVDKEIDARCSLFANSKCKSFEEYNSLNEDKKLPHKIVVIEELHYLSNKETMVYFNRIESISAKCRIFGIHLILTSLSDSIKGNIMSNSSNILEFPSAFNSIVTNKYFSKYEYNDYRHLIYLKGNGVLLREGNANILKTPLSKHYTM